MGSYDLYRKIVSCSTSPSDNLREDMKQELRDTFFQNPSYHRIRINSEDTDSHAHILYDRKLDYNGDPNIQFVAMHPDYSINTGDYVYIYDWDSHWIVPNKEGNEDVQEKAIIVQCLATWKWQDENNVVHEYPCALYDNFSTTTGFLQRKNITIPAGNMVAFVQYNEYTSGIELNQRMLFNKQAWLINKIQDMQQEGMILFYMAKDLIQADDDFTNMIASTQKYNYQLEINQSDFQQSIGYTTQLTATLTLNDVASNKDINWKVDSGLATIDNDGNLELLSDGSVVVTAYLAENENIYDTINIVITATPSSTEYIISPEDLSIKLGRTKAFTLYKYQNNVPQSTTFTPSIIGTDVPSKDYELVMVDGNNFTIKCINTNTNDLVIRFTNTVDALDYIDYSFSLVTLW